MILNPNLGNLDKKEIEKLSKNSLIRKSIKREEVEKYLDFKANSNLGDALINEMIVNKGFENKLEFSKYLREKGLKNLKIKLKLMKIRLEKM